MVAFDVFLFENGMIVEHWEVGDDGVRGPAIASPRCAASRSGKGLSTLFDEHWKARILSTCLDINAKMMLDFIL